MGADLYISAVFDPHNKKWQEKFDEAVALRNSLTKDAPGYDEAQKQVEYCFDKMYERGYFRDSYNDSNLLWRFGLSWWEDIIPMLDDKSRLSVERANQLLTMLSVREVLFGENLASLPKKERRYFRAKYGEFKQFLTQAIDAGLPIDCSL